MAFIIQLLHNPLFWPVVWILFSCLAAVIPPTSPFGKFLRLLFSDLQALFGPKPLPSASTSTDPSTLPTPPASPTSSGSSSDAPGK